jgi:hypothetical protein
MINILGIRVEPKKTHFVVITQEADGQFTVVNDECIKVPAALDFPDQLKYVRNCVLDILREYKIAIAGIRVCEANSQNFDITRLHIEGVIQEAFSSSDVEKYFIGRKSSISARLKMKPADLDLIFKGNAGFGRVQNWGVLRASNSREAALVAIGALS